LIEQARRDEEAVSMRVEGLSARVEELEADLDDALQRSDRMQEELDDATAAVAAASGAQKLANELQIEVARLQGLLEAADQTSLRNTTPMTENVSDGLSFASNQAHVTARDFPSHHRDDQYGPLPALCEELKRRNNALIFQLQRSHIRPTAPDTHPEETLAILRFINTSSQPQQQHTQERDDKEIQPPPLHHNRPINKTLQRATIPSTFVTPSTPPTPVNLP
jgi:hypothetical protein